MSYILKIVRDENPSNPWTEWDCEPPLFYVAWRWFESTSYGFENENPLDSLLAHVSDHKLALNFKPLCVAMEIEDKYYDQHKSTKWEWLRNEIEQLDPSINRIEALAKVANIHTHKWESRWYSQWDWADCIVVLTPEFIKKVGTEKEHFKSLCEGAQKLFNAYMWWDVYGFQLIDVQPLYREDGSLSDKTDDIVMDSCYGFYGDDWIDSIDEHLDDEHKPLLKEARKNIS